MKRTLFAMVVAAMAFAVNANAQFSVGVGYANESIISKEAAVLGDDYKGYSWEKNRSHLNGFYIEGAYNWEFASAGPGTFALQPGIRYYCMTDLTYNAKSNIKYETGGQEGHGKANEKSRISDHFIDIPVNVKYAYDFIPGALKGYVFAGPTFSLGIAANSVSTEKANASYDGETIKYKDIERYNAYTGKYYIKSYDTTTEEYDIEEGKDDSYKQYGMFDLKLAVGLGVTVAEKVDIKFGYNIGLLNRAFIKNTDNAKYSVHSNVLHFGVAYNF